ncbi:MAG: CPBP family intramembrane metalloprotease [Gemmatimonadetes bacterium]|nr:CPBP family intramembrane metalloprotease [Gemmatimonadota bacterium]
MTRPLPCWKVAAVLIGFPIVHFVYSLALLHRETFTFWGLDFFLTFWLGSTVIYLAKIFVVRRLIAGSGWTPADIGYTLSRKGTRILTVSYFVGALLLVLLLELALGQVTLDPDRVASMRGLYPETTAKRLVFIVMAFAAGLSEEITYRGFAIRAFQSFGIHRWPAVFLAAIPFVFQHGIKSLDQFWWFFGNGIVFGIIFIATKRLLPNILLHWLIILSALLGVFTAVAQ